jgi:hypothetical protein
MGLNCPCALHAKQEFIIPRGVINTVWKSVERYLSLRSLPHFFIHVMDGASTSNFAAGVTGTANITALAVQQEVKNPIPTEAIPRTDASRRLG